MKRVVWLTDIHLNFLTPEQVTRFLLTVAEAEPAAVLVGGDVAESPSVCDYLARMHEMIRAPIYFVLGNHDYYHGAVEATRDKVAAFCARFSRLHFLTREELAPLTRRACVVGHDGWADGRLGDYPRSLVVMHDSKLIADLAGKDKQARWRVIKALADEAAAHFRRVLPRALELYDEVLLLTHVPPFLGACWHEGRISDDQWAPHFTCHAVGEAILECMAGRPDKRLTVLCGHTHGHGEMQPLANVQVFTGGAQYGYPTITRVLSIE